MAKIYCEYLGEDIEDSEYCSECNKRYSCEPRQQLLKQEAIEAGAEKQEAINNSLYMQKIKETLKGIFSIDETMLASMLDTYYKTSVNEYDKIITECVKKIAKEKAEAYFNEQIMKRFDELFVNALEGEIICLKNDDTVVKSKIQSLIMDKIKSFLSTKDGYNGRNTIQSHVDKAIEVKTEAMFKEAFSELKAETIDKFNKDCMKAMMRGMAKQIGEDKKLLTLLSE
jgi:hypothetical protein